MDANDDVFTFGEYRIDARERRLFRRDALVPLAPKAFDLLLLLTQYNGRVLEKSDLMARLWPDSIVEEANLNVHISAIRKALGESAQHPRHVVTIPGRGYRFQAGLAPARTRRFPAWRFAAAALVAAVVLSGLALAKTASRKTTSADAKRYYEAGRHYWNKRTTSGLRRSIAEFQKAIDEDPHFALPYAGLADAYAMLGDHVGRPGDYRAQAIAAAERASKIDGDLAEVHASLAYLRMRNWEWDRVESEFRRAIAIDPSYATAHQWYSIYLELTGRPDEAIAEAARAQQLDPLSPIINESLGSRLYFAREMVRAEAQLRKTLEIAPTFENAHLGLAALYAREGRYDEALRHATPNSTTAAFVLASAKRNREALAILSRLDDADPVEVAKVHAALGDRERALDILARAAGEHIDHLAFIAVDPAWDALRDDPRFRAILRSIGLR